uniref:Uncharacterized protein n=1 Tax=Pseudomonas fluorescens (strain SBW25) TaxID=216595 RepID=A0A0G4E6L8_PSEFS|nr:hypothetical protein PQBR55_0213 [Pseudomonas fluorescens SBW25]
MRQNAGEKRRFFTASIAPTYLVIETREARPDTAKGPIKGRWCAAFSLTN